MNQFRAHWETICTCIGLPPNLYAIFWVSSRRRIVSVCARTFATFLPHHIHCHEMCFFSKNWRCIKRGRILNDTVIQGKCGTRWLSFRQCTSRHALNGGSVAGLGVWSPKKDAFRGTALLRRSKNTFTVETIWLYHICSYIEEVTHLSFMLGRISSVFHWQFSIFITWWL